jgi:ArsR family transcriptional regulator
MIVDTLSNTSTSVNTFEYGDPMSLPTELCCPPLSSEELNSDEAEELATLLKALADPVRLRLVNMIATNGQGCACDFPAALGKSQPTISHHLTQLVKAGILEREQRGKWAWFTVNPARMAAIRTALG